MTFDPDLAQLEAQRAQLHAELAEVGDFRPGSLSTSMRRCGKANCTRCPHGPYWYAYWKEGGRTRSRYVGRVLPEKALEVYEEKQRARLEKKKS